jgi:hypothetical protein
VTQEGLVFNTLRRRLILSHVLPLLVILPLMGIALIYVLETQVLLTSLSGQLVSQSRLVAPTIRTSGLIPHRPRPS